MCFQQKSGFTANEITKIFQVSRQQSRILVLNADQQMTVYEVKAGGRKGGVKLEQTAQYCLYLDEIIDLRLLVNDTDEVPKKAVICSNNEMLKVVDLETGSVV